MMINNIRQKCVQILATSHYEINKPEKLKPNDQEIVNVCVSPCIKPINDRQLVNDLADLFKYPSTNLDLN